MKTVWVFHGANAKFASAVFSEFTHAERWLVANGFSGVLTEYPLDVSVYDFQVGQSLFTPTKDEHRSKDFVQRFTSASQPHFHYENGTRQ